jgi:exosortase
MNERAVQRWLVPGLAMTILLIVLLFLFPFGSGYTTANEPLGPVLWTTWTTVSAGSQDYSYCLIVPILIVYLIFAKRSQLARAQVRGSTAAIGWILFGLLLFWIGSRAGKQYLGEAGIQVLLAGAVLWFWGGAMFRPLFFTWVFLAFAWPLPFMDSLVAFPMRMMVSFTAYHGLNLMGIPCLRQGTALFSAPDEAAGVPMGARFQIDIADPCSGIHSLFPLLMFCAIYGYLFLPRWWQQWTIFLSAFPFIVAGNVVRILLLVVGCITLGMPVALGTNEVPSMYHEGCGYAVFVVVLGLELLLAYGLMRSDPGQHKKRAQEIPREKASDPAVAAAEAPPRWRSGVMLGLAVLMLVIYGLTPGRYLPPEAGVVMSLPNQVVTPGFGNAKFYGVSAPVSEAELTILPKDTEFARKNYDDFRGHSIFFSIVLSGQQQYTIHRPEVCLTAQGWQIGKEEDVPVHVASGHDLMVRCLHIHSESLGENGESRPVDGLYMYWFVADNMTTPSHITRNWWSSWDRVLYNRDHRWAYITAMSAITESTRADGLNEAQTRAMLREFIAQVVTVIQKSETPKS